MNLFPEKIREWVPVLLLSFAVFVFGTSEFTPVGLLPDIAKAIAKTEAETGLLLTGYAWVVAIFALPLTMLTANYDRKKVIVTVLAIFILGNTLAALSKTFATILSSRVLVALSHAIFWSIIPPLAYRLSPQGKSAYGLAFISGGASASSILGVPICTYIGQRFGWNMAFYSISIISVIISLFLIFILPSLKVRKTKRRYAIYRIRKNNTLLMLYLAIVLLVTGHFSVYTYVVPFLVKFSGFIDTDIVYILTTLGIVGVLGIYIAGKRMDKNLRQVLLYPLLVYCLMLLVMKFMGFYKPLIIINMILSSVMLSMVFPAFSSWVIKLSKKDSDMASSVYSSMFNVGIGSGALIGGVTITKYGISNIGFFGFALVIPATIIIYIYANNIVKRKIKKRH